MNQLQSLQKMGGIKRLEQAFKLSDFTLELAKRNIIDSRKNKNDSEKILRELNRRLQ